MPRPDRPFSPDPPRRASRRQNDEDARDRPERASPGVGLWVWALAAGVGLATVAGGAGVLLLVTQRQAADLRRQLDAAPPGGDQQRELQERFGAANAERLNLLWTHPEWGLYESR